MLKLVIRRLAVSVPLIFIVSALVFILEALTPGDEARAMLGAGATPAQYEALRQQLGLNNPLWQQYADYIGGIFQGSLGTDFQTGVPVTALLNARLPVTLTLIILSTLAATVVGVLLGTVSAVRRRIVGRTIDVVSLAGLALPNFWLALVLVALFAVDMRLFPASGYVSFADSPTKWAASLVLPVVALALAGIAGIAKTTRESMLDVLNRDFIRTLRAGGVSEGSIVWKHALKNAAIPVASIANLIFIGALAGTVFVESVFVMPGLGTLVVNAVTRHQMNVIAGVAIYFTVIVICVNLLVDIAYGWLNPKVRSS